MECADPSGFSAAIACGGTGGHLFPGVAVAEQLVGKGCAVTLLVSGKQVDREAAQMLPDLKMVTLPAVGLEQGRAGAFLRGFMQSYRAARKLFGKSPPAAVLAMGGFTSAPPILAAKRMGGATFLHESNSIPGRANRWLSWVVDRVFVAFPSAAEGLHCRRVILTGTPVRSQFRCSDPGSCRTALGLDPARPVVLVIGGSQGARGINDLVLGALPLLARTAPEWQWICAAGHRDFERVNEGFAAFELKAIVHPFLREMKLALGAASAAVSRAGGSSLAELAAMRLPAILVPYPAATNNHQLHNARAYASTGAARLLEQQGATPAALASGLIDLVLNAETREKAASALSRWDAPRAAEQIATAMLAQVQATRERLRPADRHGSRPGVASGGVVAAGKGGVP